MRSKIYISETHGLGVLIEGVEPAYPGLLRDGYTFNQLHTWFAQLDPDNDWICWPVIDGRIVLDPDDLEGANWWAVLDSLSIDSGQETPEMPDLSANQLQCEHYQFGAGVLLRGCAGVDGTDTLFYINSSEVAWRLDPITLHQHAQATQIWASDTLEDVLRNYGPANAPVPPPAPVAETAMHPDPGPGYRLRRADEPVPAGSDWHDGSRWRVNHVGETIGPNENTNYVYRIRVAPTPTARVVIRQDAGICVLVEGVSYTGLCTNANAGATSWLLHQFEPNGRFQMRPVFDGQPRMDAPWDTNEGWHGTDYTERPTLPDLAATVLLAEHWELGVGYLVRGVSATYFIGRGEGMHQGNISGFRLDAQFAVVPVTEGVDYREGHTHPEMGVLWSAVRHVTALPENTPAPEWPPAQVASAPAPQPLETRLGKTLFMLYRTQSPLFAGSFRAKFNKVVPDLVGAGLEEWLEREAVAPVIAPLSPPPVPVVPAPGRIRRVPTLDIGYEYRETRRDSRTYRTYLRGSDSYSVGADSIRELMEEHDWDLEAAARALRSRVIENAEVPEDCEEYDSDLIRTNDSEYETSSTEVDDVEDQLRQFCETHGIEQPEEEEEEDEVEEETEEATEEATN